MNKIKGAKTPDYIYYYCLTETYQKTGASPAIVSTKDLYENQIRKEFRSRHSLSIAEIRSHEDNLFEVKIGWDYRGRPINARSWEEGKIFRVSNKSVKASVVDFDTYKRAFFVAIRLHGVLYQIRIIDTNVMRLIKEAGIAKGGDVLSPVLWMLDGGHLRLVPHSTSKEEAQ